MLPVLGSDILILMISSYRSSTLEFKIELKAQGAHHTAHEDLDGSHAVVWAGFALSGGVVDQPQLDTQLILACSLQCSTARPSRQTGQKQPYRLKASEAHRPCIFMRVQV